MPHPTKITTCCYCGARAALVLRGKVSHALSCASCGAPIRQMKRLETPEPAPRAPTRKKAVSHRPEPRRFSKPKKKKRRKSALRWFMEEAKDALEDIFD
ncbi:MAG: hypothetical protein AAF891_09785 [Pseudomonadota bacterium]